MLDYPISYRYPTGFYTDSKLYSLVSETQQCKRLALLHSQNRNRDLSIATINTLPRASPHRDVYMFDIITSVNSCHDETN